MKSIRRTTFSRALVLTAAVSFGSVVCAQAPGLPPLDADSIPATTSQIPPGIQWSAPDLGEGPFLIETAVQEHRELQVSVVARGLRQP